MKEISNNGNKFVSLEKIIVYIFQYSIFGAMLYGICWGDSLLIENKSDIANMLMTLHIIHQKAMHLTFSAIASVFEHGFRKAEQKAQRRQLATSRSTKTKSPQTELRENLKLTSIKSKIAFLKNIFTK